MNQKFALQLSDIRLLQTLRILGDAMNDHPDREAVNEALEAIGKARDVLSGLAADLPTGRDLTPTMNTVQKVPAA